jgi:hypothetical protein
MLLRWLLRASLPLGTEQVPLAYSPADPFVAFLAAQAGEPEQGLPVIGILAGNPMSEGQRLLVMVFAEQRPVAVVKAGLSELATTLVEKEEAFLKAVPLGTQGVPHLRSGFQSSRLRALALDYFAGDSPRPGCEDVLAPLLESWVDRGRRIQPSDAPDWGRLLGACPGDPVFQQIAAKLRGQTFQATLQHGDFAPWNIKVSPNGAWTVLDWERGELTGLPGWDWFHYVIQSGILVGHLPCAALVQQVENLLGSEAFQRYAELAGIRASARELLLAYLLHAAEVIRPSEGLESTRELLQALAIRWKEG